MLAPTEPTDRSGPKTHCAAGGTHDDRLKPRAARPLVFHDMGGVGTRAWLGVLGAVAAVSLGAEASGAPRETRWAEADIDLVYDASMDALGEEAFAQTRLAVEAWRTVNGVPRVRLERGTPPALGYEGGGDNVNGVYFAASGDPRAGNALAITVVTYDTGNQQILDTDVLFNGAHPFGNAGELAGRKTTGDSRGIYDMQNVMTHEIGHVLGLGEDPEHLDATMYPYSSRAELHKRDVASSDVERVSQLYTLSNQDKGCLAQIAGRNATGEAITVGVALAAAAAWWARRRAARAATLLLTLGGLSFGAGAPLDAPGAALSVGESGAALLPTIESLGTKLTGRLPVEVTASTARWNGGLIETELSLTELDCGGDGCGETPRRVRVYGGELNGVGQLVGAAHPPAVGERLTLGLYEAPQGKTLSALETPRGVMFSIKE